ncbi:MAG: hypothetical protein GX194_11075 [Clostridium sp.]|nr:hypothetical protein [Clostridium sp.]
MLFEKIFNVRSYQMTDRTVNILKAEGMFKGIYDVGSILFKKDIKEIADIKKVSKAVSGISTLKDVFNADNYNSQYGIKRMTPTKNMLESAGAFVQ